MFCLRKMLMARPRWNKHQGSWQLEGSQYLEDHPRTCKSCKWLGSPPFISRTQAIWKENPTTRSLVWSSKVLGGLVEFRVGFPWISTHTLAAYHISKKTPRKVYQVSMGFFMGPRQFWRNFGKHFLRYDTFWQSNIAGWKMDPKWRYYFLFKNGGCSSQRTVRFTRRVLCSVSSLKLGRESRLKEEDDVNGVSWFPE